MDGTAEEQRREKVQAGRAKLARFRQSKSKGESSKTQKKTKKRKGEIVRPNDVPPEKDTLVKTKYVETDLTPGAGHNPSEINLECSSLVVSECWDMSDLEARLELNQDDIDSCAEDLLELHTPPEDTSSSELQQELQTAVHKRDNIITQLSNNLQQALLSRKEIEEETLCLSTQIHAIQRQLQDASMVLKNRSLETPVPDQDQQQLAAIQSNLMDQTICMSQLDKQAQELERELETSKKTTKEKDNQIAKLENLMQEQQKRLEILQKKLEMSEDSVSHLQQELSDRNQEDLKPKMSVSIHAESVSSIDGDEKGGAQLRPGVHEKDSVESLTALVIDLKDKLAESETFRKSLHVKIEDQMQEFETEKSSWEQRHKEMVASLTLRLQHAEEIAAQDKHEKNRLNQELRDLKDNLRSEIESSAALKLQHEADLQTYVLKLQSLEEDKAKLSQKMSNTWKEDHEQIQLVQNDLKADNFRHELEDLKKTLSRVKAQKELENSQGAQLHKEEDELNAAALSMTSMDKYLIPRCPDKVFELSDCHEDSSEYSRLELDSDFILEQTLNSTVEGNVNLLSSPMPITGVLADGASLGTLLDPESFAVYLSNNVESPAEKVEPNLVFSEDIVQKCTFLMMQLQDKEQQLQKCSDALDEAIWKWREITAELTVTQLELEKEKSIKKGYWDDQQTLLEDLKYERDELRKQISEQGQLLKEVQEQKFCTEEHLSLFVKEKTNLESRLCLVENELEKALELNKNLQTSNLHLSQSLQDSEKVRERECQEFDNKLNSRGLEQQLLQEAIKKKEAEFTHKEGILLEEMSLLKQMKEDLESRLQEEAQRLNADYRIRLETSGENAREQVTLLNQEHKTEIKLLKDSHDKELKKIYSDLNIEKQKLLDDLQSQLERTHQAKTEQTLQQVQSTHNMELEALRLSLNNMHTAHLELSQSNLQKEKENALVQLRETLNDKRAQEVAILQGKHQFELEHLRDQHNQALKNLRDELSQEVLRLQEHSKELELNNQKCATETLELQEKYRKERETLQELYEQEKEECKRQHDLHCQEVRQLHDELAQESLQQLEKHARELEFLQEECAVKVSELQELHMKEKEELQELHLQDKELWEMQRSQEMEQLKEKLLQETLRMREQLQETHSQEILHLQEQHNKEKDTMEDIHVQEKQEWERLQDKHSQEMKLIREELSEETLQQHQKHLKHMELQQEEYAIKVLQLQEQYKQEVEVMEENHIAEKQEWESQRDQYVQELRQLKEEVSQETLRRTELHLNELEQLQEQYKKIEPFRDLYGQEKKEWEKQNEGQSELIKQLQEQITSRTLQLQEEHSKVIKQLQEQHSKEMKEVQEQHVLEIEEWEKKRDQHSQELDILVNQHSQELKGIGEELLQDYLQKQEEHSKLIELLKEDNSKEILCLQEQHSMEMQKMRDLHAHERERWEKQICQHFQQTQAVGDDPNFVDQTQTSLLEVNENLNDYLVQQKQDQVKNLQFGYNELKIRPTEEIQLFWSQIDSSRASRQELNELKEKLIARSTQLEEIEKMKHDFEQERSLLKAVHEMEMVELRIYFEQKSRAAEETYREELKILHQRLREMNDEEITIVNSSSLALDDSFESEKIDLLQHLTDQLEHHKEELSYLRLQSEEKEKQDLHNLHAALTVQYKEDVLNMKMDLSDKFTAEIENLKKKHCLELEQLRAKLSEEHIKEITWIHLQNTQKTDWQENEEIENTPPLGIDYHNQDFGAPHVAEVESLAMSSSDDHVFFTQADKANSDKISPREPHHNSLCVHVCEKGSGTHSEDAKEMLSDESSQFEILQNQHTKGLAILREIMVCELEEITKRLQEKGHGLRKAEDRTAQLLVENANLQKNLLGEPLMRTVSVQYKSEASNAVSNLQFQEVNLCSCISEKKHSLESGTYVSQLQHQDKGELRGHLLELQLHSDRDLNFHLSELQNHREKELCTLLSELLQKYQEELKARDLEHEALVQSQEALHLLKLDTLESSYLTEIQKIRDEHTLAVEELELCLDDRLQEKEKEIQDRLEIARVQWVQQQEQELQSLRQDLASVHLEKFQAMAGELQDAHRDDLREQLEQQRYQLDEENSQALDALREEVLRMEAQHQLALEELRDLQRIEVQQQTQKLQDELRKMTEDFQKQELHITELSSHRQALSTELQSKSDQQLQFQEEIELLKCQSEMLLEQQITLLKDEFNAEKKAALQVVEEQLTRDTEQVRAEHQLEKDHLMEELQEKSTVVQQLQEKISVLAKEMDASQSQMDVLVQRRERENQEGEHLVAMLQSDAQTAQQEQTKLQESCQRFLKIFTDVLKSTLITEDLICKKIGLCLDNSLSPTDDEKSMDTLAKSSGEKSRMSPDCETMTENSLMSTDEGFELSEYLCDSVLGSLEVGLENEDKIVRMSQRLRTAVERLLDMVSDSALQLEQTREMQKCFENEFKGRNQEMAQVVVQNQELLKQLAQETEEKNRLQMELHKSQGLIEGYAAEKAALEEALSAKEGSEHQLVVELEKSREQLKVLTQEPSVFGEEKEVLLRLQEVLSGSVRDVEVELLKETERLVKEKLELHCQAKKDRSNLLSQMRVLEMELEEQMARNQELLRKTNEMNDLQQQIQSLEKQLKNQRHFMDEQAVEREHERDDFQQEIRNLEEQLKQATKNHGDSRAYGLHDWSAQIETLQAHVKEKADNCNLLLQGRDHLEQQIAERNEEIDKMLMRIQELEQAALSNEEAAKKCIQLEAELQKIHKIEKELLQDKDALEQQQYTNVLQISALQSKLDEARHRVPVELDTNSLLKEELKAEREALQRKEKEAESLAEQLELFREDLMNKTEEVLQLNMQLEIQRKQSDQAVQQAQEKYLQVKDEMSNLHYESVENSSSTSMHLPQALLQEKNQEIDHLNEQLLMVQQEAANSQFAEVEELRSLVEHLRSDQERLHKDKEEEVEQLHEVIQKLQQELEQLGPIRHEISDSQESLDQLGLGKVENLQIELRKGVQQLEVSSAQGKLDETASLYKADLEAFQQQLEEKESLHITEIEVLEKNLQNLQQSNRQHERALHSLHVQHMSLQEESELLRTRVSEREEEVATLSSHLQELQDVLRERNASLVETELLVQTLQEQNAGDRSELENQLTEYEQSLEAAKIDLQKVQEQNVSLQNIMSKSSREQSERDEKFKEEIQELKQLLREWEEKAQKRTEESQTQTDHPEMLELEITSHMVALKEQLSAAENQVKVREMELRSTEIQFANTKRELEELHAECDCREAEAQQVLQQLKKRDACVAELQSHSQNLGTQVKKLQEALVSQETMINLVSGEFHRKHLEDQKNKPDMSVPSMKPKSFSESLTDLSTWDSPEMVRKQEEQIHSLRVFTSFSELSVDHSAELDFIRSKSSGHVKQPEQGDLLASSTPSLSGSNFSMQHSNNTQRASLLGETEHPVTDYDSSDDQRSSRDDQRDTEPSDELDYKLEGEARSESDDMGNLFNIKQKMNSISDRGLSTQLQRMLNMVHEESCKILELSERPVENTPDPECSELVIQRDTWQKEKQNLQETIQSLSSALAQAAGKSEKESTASDWRRELLQSMQALLESEREYLRLELQAHLHRGSGDKNTLSEKMEHLIKEQEVQKRLVLDHVLAADRSSLLSEIQDLRSQLRMAHLQNQEKLQQLQDTLTSTEERGHTKEHQLRRQVELLEYKLQQEASIGEDLKGSLLHEKERASEQYRLLLQEQATVSQLRSEQQEKELELEKLRKSQKELQIGKSKLRNELESKEQAIAVCTQTMQTQKKAENQRFEEEKARTQLLALKEKALQEASVTLEEQRILNTKISAGLSQEQTYSSNLRKELEIEQSRCKALLAQEHGKMAEAEKELQKERTHSISLSNALTLERNMLEQLRQQHDHVLSKKEDEQQQEQKMVLTLQSQLEEERRRSRDLATMVEKTQHQVVHAKRQLESEVQACREETQSERENAIKLRSLFESLQGQKQQLESVLEQQSEREIRLQKERDQYQAQLLILQEEERVWAKECENETKRPKHTEVNRVRELEKDQRIMDLQLQHERDVRRIQELQHMLADLEEQERALASRKNLFRSDASSPAKNVDSVTIHLQRIWQQLLHTVLKVKKWVQNRSDGVQKDFPNEAEVTALLNSLAELKSEIQQGFVQLPAQSLSSVINVLKRENEELTNTVSQLTKEKLELRSQLTKLTRSLQGTPQKEVKEQPHSDVNSVLEAERAVWHREKRLLQVALKHAESELGKATLENRPLSDVPNSKMQRLYRRYLRAESFRKALVYQKKYLLLLLGGFQACEKATLSLIARMGVYPSPADLQIPRKCQSSLTRFRSAVRAVIAISRLKFLVRKWHKINRKDGVEEPLTQQVTVKRTEVLQQGSTMLNSPPTRDLPFGVHHSPNTTIGSSSLKPSPFSSKWLNHSPVLSPEIPRCASQDPEQSITEYIHHLEMVQRRLGGLQNGHSPEHSRVKYVRK
ncbi:pericentrin [Mixophyes fleayi]|uniref:pericentrin n=1 Tax=Mixophyes fleayi TaxID=3061075 RepID=UPI003F4DB6C6